MKTNQKLLTFIMAIFPIIAQAQNNIIYQESFEQKECGWTFSTSEGSTIESGFVPIENHRPAADGEKCLNISFSSKINSFTSSAQSPSIALKAQQTYYISFFYDVSESGGLQLSVQQESSELSTPTLLYNSQDFYTYLEITPYAYRKVMIEYTPQTSGNYLFNLINQTNYVGNKNLYIDLFKISTSIDKIEMGKTNIRGGLWEISSEEEKLFLPLKNDLEINQEIENAFHFDIQQQNNTLPFVHLSEKKIITFVQHFEEGENNIKIIANNKKEKTEKNIIINAISFEPEKTYTLSQINHTEKVKSFFTTGPIYAFNSFYHKAAEKYEMPNHLQFTLNGFIFRATQRGDENFNIKINIIPTGEETENTLGTPLFSFETTKKDFLAHPLPEKGKNYYQFNFPEKAILTGSFYLQLTFPEWTNNEVKKNNFICIMGIERNIYRFFNLKEEERYKKYNTSFKYVEKEQKWKPFYGFTAYIAPIITTLKRTDHISDVNTKAKIIHRRYYNLSGRLVINPQQKGLFIQETIYSDGSIKREKVIQ